MGLFKPAWMTDKEKKLPKALAAVEQMTSKSDLNQVALSAPLAPVAQAAISRITDDELLLEIARNRFNDEVGLAAVGHVDDQDALVRFMIVDKPTGAVGKAVFKRIKLDQVSDRERLTALAHCAPTADDRSKVLAMLDYEELMDVYLRADDTRRHGFGKEGHHPSGSKVVRQAGNGSVLFFGRYYYIFKSGVRLRKSDFGFYAYPCHSTHNVFCAVSVRKAVFFARKRAQRKGVKPVNYVQYFS